jgi:type II secretory pathway pseudopilin PulG
MRPDRGRGVTLVECCVAIGIIFAVGLITGPAFERGLQASRAARGAVAATQAAETTLLQLTSDLRQARTVATAPPGLPSTAGDRSAPAASLSLCDGRRVGYEVRDGRLLRRLRRADGTERTDVCPGRVRRFAVEPVTGRPGLWRVTLVLGLMQGRVHNATLNAAEARFVTAVAQRVEATP